MKNITLFFLLLAAGCVTGQTKTDNLVLPDIPAGQPQPWTAKPVEDQPEEFHFAIISDRTGGHREGVFEDAIRKVNLLRPAFVINVGDLIEGGSVDTPEIYKEWAEIDELVKPLNMKFFHVPGNHDYGNEAEAKIWNERFGRGYYHFLYKGVLFLVLNTEQAAYEEPGKEQIEYFAKVLAENPNPRWTMVFMHVPLWIENRSANWRKMEELLKDRPHNVFAGHWHEYCKYDVNNHKYIVLAPTGGGTDKIDAAQGIFDEIAWVTIPAGSPAEPVFANLDLKGIYDENLKTGEFNALKIEMENAIEVWGSPLFTEDKFSGGKMEIYFKNYSPHRLLIKGHIATEQGLAAGPAEMQFYVPGDTEGVIYNNRAGVSMDRYISRDSTKSFATTILAKEPIEPQIGQPIKLDYEVSLAGTPDAAPTIKKTFQFGIAQTYRSKHAPYNIKVDGKLDEWVAGRIIFFEPPQNETSDERGFGIASCYDDKFVYIAVEVRDPEITLPKDCRSLEGYAEILDHDMIGNLFYDDALEIRFDAREELARSIENGWHLYENGHLLIGFYPGDGKSGPIQMLASKLPVKITYAFSYIAGGYSAEIAIPIEYVKERQGENWKAYRLNVVVHDRHADGKFVRTSWQPDWRSPQNISGSGTFVRWPPVK